MPKDVEKTYLDYKLTCYACYLIAQNGNSRKCFRKLFYAICHSHS